MMNTIKKNLIVGTTILFVLLTYAFSQFMIAQESKIIEKCGPVKDGLQFCSESSVISAEINKPVMVTLLLKNVSEEEIRINNFGSIHYMYEISVKSPSGKKVDSNRELRAKKAKDEGRLPQLPFGSSPFGDKVLKPDGVYKLTFDLGHLYKFEKEGEYKVTINRLLGRKLVEYKDIKPNKKPKPLKKLSLGTIRVQIRGSEIK